MANLFVLCGPPGAGKTTLLKMVKGRKLGLKQLQRITTRKSRKEEGDNRKRSLEYEFLGPTEFLGRLSMANAANFIEWNGNFYATDFDALQRELRSSRDCLLFEDMPSAVHLRRLLGSQVTVILLFTAGEEELLKVQFASPDVRNRESFQEWERRLGLKYTEATKHAGKVPTEEAKAEYIDGKLRRAMVDLAFMAGRLRNGEDIRVLPNRRDKQEDAYKQLREIVKEVQSKTISNTSTSKFAFALMPFQDDFNKFYRFVIKPAVEIQGLTCLRGDETNTTPIVLDDILIHIEKSEFIIADISGGNPNVFLELGISLKLQKRIILLTQDRDSAVPFDVQPYRRISYENTGERLENTLRRNV